MYEARGFEGTGISGPELDRYITGNFGADQYKDEEAIEYGWDLALDEAEDICFNEHLGCEFSLFIPCPCCLGTGVADNIYTCPECSGLTEVFNGCDIGFDYERCPEVERAANSHMDNYILAKQDSREDWNDE
jgi:RecJ-like exonuclease